MTLYHFANCLALLYAPYHMAYKYSGISEYGAFSKCIQAGGIYIFTQLCKMLLLATFFPDSDANHLTGEYNIFLELLKATVDFADLLGLYIGLASVPGKSHAKILTVAVGWAGAEVLVSRCLPLWVGARGAEFSWKHMISCCEANMALVTHASTTGLVWMWSRRQYAPAISHVHTVTALLLCTPYRSLAEIGAAHALRLGAWSTLALRAIVSSVHSLFTLSLYAALQQQIGS